MGILSSIGQRFMTGALLLGGRVRGVRVFFKWDRALVARGCFILRSSGLRSARARGRAGFFFELVLALVARGGFYSFGQMALRSARARGRAGFFFKLVLALVARGWFFLLVKWLCAPRGCACGVGLVFSFGQMALRSARVRLRRGAGFFFRSNGLRSAQARGREGCFESPLPTSGLHSPRNELRAARP